MLIGLTLVGFGTSTPELVTSLVASFRDAPGIAVGNVVGSNIANILLILGLAALASPLALSPQAYRRDGAVLALSTAACLGAMAMGLIEPWMGAALVGLALAYLYWAYSTERDRAPSPSPLEPSLPRPRADLGRIARSLGLAVIGIVVTVFGARTLVTGAIDIAEAIGISQTVVGLTIVAVGTSLPELVACLIAAVRRHPEIALGNAIGSNIFNVLGVLGIVALAGPLEVPPQIMRFDVWILAGATVLLLAFLRTGWRLGRWEGAALVSLYIAYVGASAFLIGQGS